MLGPNMLKTLLIVLIYRYHSVYSQQSFFVHSLHRFAQKGTQPLSTLHFSQKSKLAALPKPSVLVTQGLVDGQQGTYVPSLISSHLIPEEINHLLIEVGWNLDPLAPQVTGLIIRSCFLVLFLAKQFVIPLVTNLLPVNPSVTSLSALLNVPP